MFTAWREFKQGKNKKVDVRQFEFKLEDNIFAIHDDLKVKIYQHSQYTTFNVCDPKLRRIHKACVRDRILHHAVFRILYPIFDPGFIYDSYSCRIEKGSHRAVKRLAIFSNKLSCNDHETIFALKCDIRKYFASIDQSILLNLIKKKITDTNTLWLIEKIVKSTPLGLPLGNVTSQLFANIYLNEFDQFVKHRLKAKYYQRYCDDFIILGKDERYLEYLVAVIDIFLQSRLKLSLHPKKVIIRKFRQGIDFLGYVVLPGHIAVRTKTKKRIFRKLARRKNAYRNSIINKTTFDCSVQSYLGILKHANAFGLRNELFEMLLM